MKDRDATRSLLTHAVTRYDRAEAAKAARNRRAYYNPYALGIYLGRVDDIMADLEKGSTLEDAVAAAFNDRLRDHVLKFCTEKATLFT